MIMFIIILIIRTIIKYHKALEIEIDSGDSQ